MFESKLLPVKRIMQRNVSPFLILFFLSALMCTELKAQNYRGHNWYFGSSPLGLRFSRSDNSASVVNNKATPFGPGGSAVASDPVNGNLLFYTDGSSIFDGTHQLMTNGSLLGAVTSANQPVAIAKAPGAGKRYFVFVNDANFTTGGTIRFRMVDMNRFGNAIFPSPALGEAETATNTDVTGLTGRSEAMIVIPHANGEDFWLITHANGTPDYTVTPFTLTGPGTSTTVSLGLIQLAANFSYHERSGRIAVSPQETTRDIEIVTFDNSNGTFSPTVQRINNSDVASTTNQAIYDTEWSNSGDFLYISIHGETGIQADVLQYDVVAGNISLASVLPQPNTILRSFGLQMAPDSAIYHLYQNAGGVFQLGTITNTDTVASAVTYRPLAFTSNPNFNGTQFPSFAPQDSILLNITFTTEGTCANSPVSFFPTVTPAADSILWRFGDGNAAVAWSPVHTYEDVGPFTARATAFLNGDTAFFELPINLDAFDLQLQLVQDTTACACELPINNGKTTVSGANCPNDTSDDMTVKVSAQGGNPSYQWFGPGGPLLGQTTETLRPDSAGYYYVVATIGLCSAYAGVNIKEYDSLDQRANIWYFGQNAGIDFNGLPNDPPVAISGPLNTPEGTSVISDRNGQVIFSTDGLRIYDKTDTEIPIPVPPGLGGENTSTQSALIIPVPGDETLFYIFTTQEIHGSGRYELRYSLFDLKRNNGLGDLVEFNQLLFAKSTERITSNGNWLIAHEYGNNSFRAYRISADGIGSPVISAAGSDHSFSVAEEGQGYMEIGAQSRIAVALSHPGTSNVVEVFDFIDSTGMVTNFRTADLKSTTGQVYGIEISPGGNKLYATLKNTGSSQMYEFAFDSLGNPYFKQSVTQTGELGAMQIGPDGQIYVAINGSTDLGTFSANEDTTSITPLAIPLQPFTLAGGTTSGLGLPNFTQIIANPAMTPGFNFAGVCAGDSTEFSATGKDPAIDKFYWTFGDGQSIADGGATVNHLYPDIPPGSPSVNYTVTLVIYNKCQPLPAGYATFTQTITINAPPADPTSAAVLCTGQLTLDANPIDAPDLSYQWITGDTTETITVNRPARFLVTITDENTCSTDAEFVVVDNRPRVEFGPNLTICQNTPIRPLDAQNPGATYVWEVGGAPNGNTAQTQTVNTSSPVVVEYKVQVTDPITTCFARDSVTYTINQSPSFIATPTDPTTCTSNDGQISINITAPVASLFSYFVAGPSPGLDNNGTDKPVGVVTPPTTGLDGGTYGITVSDQVSGCATSNTVTLDEPGFTVVGSQNGTCDPITIGVVITTTPGPAPPPYNYRVINAVSNDEEETGSNAAVSFATLTPLPSNNQQYIVEVTSGSCTVSSPNITVDEDPEVPITLNTDPCNNPITLTVTSAGDTFAWTGPAITSATNTPTITATPPQGSQAYDLTVTRAGFCQSDTTITVLVEFANPDFVVPNSCADEVTLAATPVGNYTYRWFANGTALPGGGGQQIVVTATGDYRFDLVSTVSGCIFPSQQKLVSVDGDLQVSLTTTTPCQGSPFILTAVATPIPVTFTWELNGTTISGQTNSTLADSREGIYTVNATRGACAESLDFSIVLAPIPPGLLQDTGIICPGSSEEEETMVELDAGPNNTSYTWYLDGVVIPSETDQTLEAREIGLYRVELLNSFGCTNADQIQLIEECDPRITGPNAFRPSSALSAGGEFVNREFKLFTFFIDDEDFQIFIFNRWGEMIYESQQRDFRWNGGYNNNLGQPLPAGTYSYVVKYKSSYRPEEGVKEMRSGVVLLR